MDALILCIETSTVPFSVTISNGDAVISCVENGERTSLASQITLMIDQCCKEANISIKNINAVAISPGPGSYTGLRIGMSVAKGLCFALNVPMIFLSGLKSLADSALRTYGNEINEHTLICPALDARRDEVYMEVYDHLLNQLLPSTAVILPHKLSFQAPIEYKSIICIGDGGSKLIDMLGDYRYVLQPLMSSASWMVPLAYQCWLDKKFESITTTEPFYLKPPNITTPRIRSL